MQLINESKWQKQVAKIQYWQEMVEQLATRSDEGALTDSQDENGP